MVLTGAALLCMAQNVFFEARGETTVDAQLAVIEVTLNRVADKRYPNTVCDVVFAPHAFSWTKDGLTDDPEKYTNYADREAWIEIQELVVDVAQGRGPTLLGLSSTHYFAAGTSVPNWASHYSYDGQVGSHLFFTNDTPYK